MVIIIDNLKEDCCKICGTDKEITRHHIRPRCFVKKKLKGPSPCSRTIKLCKLCHLEIHKKPGAMRRFMHWLQRHKNALWWDHTYPLEWLGGNIDSVEKRCGQVNPSLIIKTPNADEL